MNSREQMGIFDVIQCMSGQEDSDLRERLRYELNAFNREGSEPPASIPMGPDATAVEPRYWVRPRSSRARTSSIGRMLGSSLFRITTAASIVLTILYFGTARWWVQPTRTPTIVPINHTRIADTDKTNKITVDHFNRMTDQVLAKIREIQDDDSLDRAIQEQQEAILALSLYEQSRPSYGSWQQLPDPSEVERLRQDVQAKTQEVVRARNRRAEILSQITNVLKIKPYHHIQKFLSYDDLSSIKKD
jgi:hypothetical protein